MIHTKQFLRILRSGSGHSVLAFVQKKKIQIKYDMCIRLSLDRRKWLTIAASGERNWGKRKYTLKILLAHFEFFVHGHVLPIFT